MNPKGNSHFNTFRQLGQFLRNPLYEEDENHNFRYRLIILLKLVGWALLLSFVLFSVIMLTEHLFQLDFGQHASEELMNEYPTAVILLLIVIIAPFAEELFFRGPLVWFRNKPIFKYIFFLSVILFGAIHLTNFSDVMKHLWVAPLLVSPQLSLGIFTGFIRVRFGLIWSIALHALYNLILSMPLILADLLNLPLE